MSGDLDTRASDQKLEKRIATVREDHAVVDRRRSLHDAAVHVFASGYLAGRQDEARGMLRAITSAESRAAFDEHERAVIELEFSLTVHAIFDTLEDADDLSELRRLIEQLEVERRQGWAAYFRLREEGQS